MLAYVNGCSVQTYNELINILWSGFRDLQGIEKALEEMLANSVEANSITERNAERACREAMRDQAWLDRTDEGDQVAMATLSRISELIIEVMAAKDKAGGVWQQRKRNVKAKSFKKERPREEVATADPWAGFNDQEAEFWKGSGNARYGSERPHLLSQNEETTS